MESIKRKAGLVLIGLLIIFSVMAMATAAVPRDSDGDGYSDIDEMLAKTDPNDSNSYSGAPTPTPVPTSATRDIEKQMLTPGESTSVSVTITNSVTQALSLDEDIPAGWTLTRVSDDAHSFNPETNEWVWFSVAAGATKTVIYSLTVASNATAGDYTITGRISNATGVIDTVKGENTIIVEVPPVPKSASATRDIEKQTLAPGKSTNITVTITNNVTQSLSLDEDIPAGWTLTRGTDDADAFKPTTNEWVWFSVAAGATKTVIYSLTVASNATAGNYYVNGTISNATGVIDTVKGETLIALADILDYYRCLYGDCEHVSTMELLAAANDWCNDIAPPGFTEPITTMQLMQLASEWASA